MKLVTLATRRWFGNHARFSTLAGLKVPTQEDAQELFRRMDSRPGSVITTHPLNDANDDMDPTRLDKYNQDMTKQYRGDSAIVVRPKSTEEVSSILKFCNDNRIGVVPQAGNTGLVGGSVPLGSEVILSVEQLNQIHGFTGSSIDSDVSVSDSSGILKAGAGSILQDLQDYAAQYGHLFPVDLGAKGTCQIGGNLSTNAGGSYYYRYGSLHANIMGVEVVLPNGDIMNLGMEPTHLKDNTGYDLKHLFVGAEGTLGVVTNVAMLCPNMPKAKCAAFLSCQTFEDVCRTLAIAKSELSEILAAYEFMDGPVLEIVQGQNIDIPLSEIPPYAVLVETHGSNEDHDQEKMATFVERVMTEGMVDDGVLSQNLDQVEEFWKVREFCNPAVAANGFVYKYDISLAIADFPVFIERVRSGLETVTSISPECINWGHVVDGNLHCNVVVPGKYEKDEDLYQLIEKLIVDGLVEFGGSISAEHGLGQYKHKHLPKFKDPATLASMRAIKGLFDPNGILNPGKYLPVEK